MKILKQGTYKLKEYFFRCPICSCEFIADESEVETSKNIYGGYISIYKICPCCKRTEVEGELNN